jgi:HEAT repeat protein
MEDPAPGSGEDREDTTSPTEGSVSYDERLAHFIALLSDDDDISRWKAAETLGRIGDPAATEELIATLWDDDARVRLKAAWALGRIGDEQAVPPLRRLYRMENEGGQEIIREALEAIRNRAGSQIRANDRDPSGELQ